MFMEKDKTQYICDFSRTGFLLVSSYDYIVVFPVGFFRLNINPFNIYNTKFSLVDIDCLGPDKHAR